MPQTKRKTAIIALVSMVSLLGAGYLLDVWSDSLKHKFITFEYSFTLFYLYLWLIPFLFLGMVIGAFVLFRFIIQKENRSQVLFILFTVVGLFSMLIPALALALGVPKVVLSVMNWLTYNSWFFLVASVLVAAIGILGLVFSRRNAE
jgi:hypothetical protein